MDFVGAKFQCTHDLAEGNYRIQIRKTTLERSKFYLHRILTVSEK